ncbi:MAG TPA: metal ABC transporter ATP-binding protein [Candidatus Dormibacteraeota bacterium]|nr:metal ABC transporter ATP-binding protein [Candidatus Dormibacteraeota bacterium]
MSAAVEATHLTVSYDGRAALVDVTFALAPGHVLGIIGPNGSGKSTLLKATAGLLQPHSGTLRVFGKPPTALPPGAIAYVPQIEAVDWSFPATVRDVVAMGRFPKLGRFRPFSDRDRQLIDSALDAVEIRPLEHRAIAELSGGQQQRTFLARALAQEPDLYLLDEPTTGVDAATEAALLGVVREIAAAGKPVMMSTHALERAAEWFDRLLVLDTHQVAEGSTAEVLAKHVHLGTFHVHGHHKP